MKGPFKLNVPIILITVAGLLGSKSAGASYANVSKGRHEPEGERILSGCLPALSPRYVQVAIDENYLLLLIVLF